MTAAARATSGLALLAVATATLLAACDDGTPPARGFASRQLRALRDPTLRFYFTVTGEGVNYTTGGDDISDPKRYWSIDVETGAITEHEGGFPNFIPPATTTPARFRCAWTEGDGVESVVITDTQTSQQVTIEGIVPLSTRCPTDAEPRLTHWRRSAGGQLQLWTGPFDAMAPAPLDVELAVVEVLAFRDGVTTVIAGTQAQPAATGIHAIDVTSFAVTEVIPAALASGAWAAGAAPGGALASTRVVPTIPSPIGGFTAQDLYNGRFLYRREMADGSMTAFMGPFADGPARELALFGLDQHASLTRLGLALGQIAWRQYSSNSALMFLHLFDDGRRQLVTCPLPDARTPGALTTLVGAATADGASVLFSPQPFNPDYDIVEVIQSPGPAVLVSPAAAVAGGGATACTTLSASYALAGGVSPDGTTLFWLLAPPDASDTQLWIAAADGSGQRLLGTGPILGPPYAPHFIGDSRLQLTLGRDLQWLDVHDDPVRMHYIAEQVFGTAIDVGDWLVTGYDYSDQDATGRLGVVNREMGNPLPISPEVDLYISPDLALQRYWQLPPDRVVHVVYVVRGRNPSPQDGLWLATIDGAALP